MTKKNLIVIVKLSENAHNVKNKYSWMKKSEKIYIFRAILPSRANCNDINHVMIIFASQYFKFNIIAQCIYEMSTGHKTQLGISCYHKLALTKLNFLTKFIDTIDFFLISEYLTTESYIVLDLKKSRTPFRERCFPGNRSIGSGEDVLMEWIYFNIFLRKGHGPSYE